ncbi:MAG: hypothetical protein M1294_04180 [Firmicutes bacterium]|nr:hypothetical protein [Bacillota bacterium]MCL5013724.1 hypothetical protein [Bacillota bacterium]
MYPGAENQVWTAEVIDRVKSVSVPSRVKSGNRQCSNPGSAVLTACYWLVRKHLWGVCRNIRSQSSGVGVNRHGHFSSCGLRLLPGSPVVLASRSGCGDRGGYFLVRQKQYRVYREAARRRDFRKVIHWPVFRKAAWVHWDIAGLAFNDTENGLGAKGHGVAIFAEICRHGAHMPADV